jgi:orotidine-5'-phosphate decarboxylase
LKVDLLTVHAQGGVEMLIEALDNAEDTLILVVTLLTSLKPEDLIELSSTFMINGNYVHYHTKRASDLGAKGFVASPSELSLIRETIGEDPVIVTPGIRPKWAKVEKDDQVRIGTPVEAIKNGATLLVVGRPIRDSKDPLISAQKTIEEIESAIK